jgi:hypothetical protein
MKIRFSGEVVGLLDYTTNYVGPKYLDELGLTTSLSKVRLTRIKNLAINSKWRRLGLAAKALNKLEKADTLLFCFIGSGVEGGFKMNPVGRIKFYKKQGFSIIYRPTDIIGFKFIEAT